MLRKAVEIMKLSTMTIAELKLEMALHKTGSSIYNAAYKELCLRYTTPLDISNESAVIEILISLHNAKKGK